MIFGAVYASLDDPIQLFVDGWIPVGGSAVGEGLVRALETGRLALRGAYRFEFGDAHRL